MGKITLVLSDGGDLTVDAEDVLYVQEDRGGEQRGWCVEPGKRAPFLPLYPATDPNTFPSDDTCWVVLTALASGRSFRVGNGPNRTLSAIRAALED